MANTFSAEHVKRIAPLIEPQTPIGEALHFDGSRAIPVDVSIAISLKRIADAFERAEKKA